MLKKAHLFRKMKCKPEVYGKMMQNSEVVDCSSKNEVLPPSKASQIDLTPLASKKVLTPLASKKVLTPLASKKVLTPLNSQKALMAWLLQASPGSTSFENFSTSFP